MSYNKLWSVLVSLGLYHSPHAFAQSELETCLFREINTGDQTRSIAQVKTLCLQQQAFEDVIEIDGNGTTGDNDGTLSTRLSCERLTAFNFYVIAPHKMNCMLPAYSTNAIIRDAYQCNDGFFENLDDFEATFQISLKVPIFENCLFVKGDGLFLGFTLQAWWQIYANNISKPFRETNYQSELFYFTPLGWQPFDGNTAMIVGIKHQSNGRSQIVSRSWN